MKKKLWFYVCIVQALFIILVVTIFLRGHFASPRVKETSLQNYIDLAEQYDYIPEQGYIPDAKTARKIGVSLIDSMSGMRRIGWVTVEYDAENRVWKIHKSYWIGLLGVGFGGAGGALLEQDTGDVIIVYLEK
ncbi:MAG: hypothetical protein LBO63_00210 [Oscillospiraceae bacterium]|jgi:hypothetical protein|nr:hypothetical protein [Oscillospiraceae bacterium]